MLALLVVNLGKKGIIFRILGQQFHPKLADQHFITCCNLTIKIHSNSYHLFYRVKGLVLS